MCHEDGMNQFNIPSVFFVIKLLLVEMSIPNVGLTYLVVWDYEDYED